VRRSFSGAQAVPRPQRFADGEASGFCDVFSAIHPLRPGTGRAPLWLRLCHLRLGVKSRPRRFSSFADRKYKQTSSFPNFRTLGRTHPGVERAISWKRVRGTLNLRRSTGWSGRHPKKNCVVGNEAKPDRIAFVPSSNFARPCCIVLSPFRRSPDATVVTFARARETARPKSILTQPPRSQGARCIPRSALRISFLLYVHNLKD
jgi:hypothetical protein